MSELPRVAGVVLNYNGKDVTLETLSSLVEVDYPHFDLLVVDNGSTDGSWEVIAEQYPQVEQIKVELKERLRALSVRGKVRHLIITARVDGIRQWEGRVLRWRSIDDHHSAVVDRR